MSKINLFRRVKRLERIINEAKQVGDLYHVCTLNSYIKYIKPNDTLSSSGNYKNYLHGKSTEYISFTRSSHFNVKTNDAMSADVLVQLVIDGDILSENYKIGPYNDFAFTSKIGAYNDFVFAGTADLPENRDREEAVKGPIKNISKYIKEINVFPADITSSSTYTALSASGLVEQANYFNFCTEKHNNNFARYLRSFDIVDGTPFDEVM